MCLFASRYNHTEPGKRCKAKKSRKCPVFDVFRIFAPWIRFGDGKNLRAARERGAALDKVDWSFMPFEEVVEAEGHLIDSHVMEQIFDKVVESSGRFEVEQFRIGRTNGDPSY